MLLLTLKQKAKSKPKKNGICSVFQRKFMYWIGNGNTIKCMNYSLNLKTWFQWTVVFIFHALPWNDWKLMGQNGQGHLKSHSSKCMVFKLPFCTDGHC